MVRKGLICSWKDFMEDQKGRVPIFALVSLKDAMPVSFDQNSCNPERAGYWIFPL